MVPAATNILSRLAASVDLTAHTSVEEREELIFSLIASLPRSRLIVVYRRIAPLLHFDLLGSLPTETALQILSLLSPSCLLTCGLVSQRWHALTNDQGLWMQLCRVRGWKWRQPLRSHFFTPPLLLHDCDDEGMGDSDGSDDDDDDGEVLIDNVETAKAELTLMQAEMDSGFLSMTLESDVEAASSSQLSVGKSGGGGGGGGGHHRHRNRRKPLARHSAPASLKAFGSTAYLKPDYKFLFLTHLKLHNRFLHASYRLSALQARGTPTNVHRNTIYCLQLYTYPSGLQVLFTGSRDKTVKEWNLATGEVERVISGVHTGSILSICAYNGFLASAGSDMKVVIWDLAKNEIYKVLDDHEDSVLCVRFNDRYLVSCSKDSLVRTYSFPSLEPKFVLRGHRAAVNAIALSKSHIVSGSGDHSIRLWDAKTGKLLRTFDNHHRRGIASIDFQSPFILTGSSDSHLRLIDMNTSQGWSTSPEDHFGDDADQAHPPPLSVVPPVPVGWRLMCQVCGSENVHLVPEEEREPCTHSDLVRSVALGQDLVISASYDMSIKVWDRRNGALIADLKGGHSGRIFCVTFDHTKIVSCGEDQSICIWDFSHGIDTSFLHYS